MAGRSRSSFNKRQKERSRQDKQREKLERKQQRKAEKQTGGSTGATPDDFGTNEILDDLPTEVTIFDSDGDE